MRMRRKKNQDIRLQNCHNIMVLEPGEYKGRWNEYFKNNNEIHIEIGCGRGRFIVATAKKYPDINFIAIEKDESALLSAMEQAKAQEIKNLVFISFFAQELVDVFENEEISRIYLNFSDPWPRKKQAGRRLTHKNFLEVYAQILKNDGYIHFKTDNQGLFEFSLEEFSANAWKMRNISLDLHASAIENNVMTEYEEKFSTLGFRIYRVELSRQ